MGERDKPTVADLGVDVDTVRWQGSGNGPDALQVAFVGEWVLMRAGAGAGEVLVFDHAEWDAFLRGVKDEEFDDAASSTGGSESIS